MTAIAANYCRDDNALTRLHWVLIFTCAIGFGIDLMEVSIQSALTTIFSAAPYHVSAKALSWLSSSIYMGAIVGAPLGGWAARRFGYANTLAFAAAWLGLTALAAGFSPNPTVLTGVRALTGLAVGAFPPVMIAFIAEAAPPARRGQMTFTVCTLAYLFPPSAIFSIRALNGVPGLPLEAWRWPYLIASVLSIFAVLAFVVAAREGSTRAPAAATKPEAPFTVIRRPWALILSLNLLNPLATVGFPLIVGPVMLSRGAGVKDALAYVAAAALGPAIGALITQPLVDLVGRGRALLIAISLMITAVASFLLFPSPIVAAVASLGFGITSQLFTPVMTVLAAEVFAPSKRAVATSLAWSANRVAAVLAPFVLLPLAKAGHLQLVTGVIGLSLVGAIGAVLAWAPQKRQDA